MTERTEFAQSEDARIWTRRASRGYSGDTPEENPSSSARCGGTTVAQLVELVLLQRREIDNSDDDTPDEQKQGDRNENVQRPVRKWMPKAVNGVQFLRSRFSLHYRNGSSLPAAELATSPRQHARRIP
ncbi:MAG TPA: hypothetical protein VGQ38_14895 [Gaiellaceae bacterium]|nr:hypothetical protein [Gaiellaceae bacterium]